jgi:hypothetical protein
MTYDAVKLKNVPGPFVRVLNLDSLFKACISYVKIKDR